MKEKAHVEDEEGRAADELDGNAEAFLLAARDARARYSTDNGVVALVNAKLLGNLAAALQLLVAVHILGQAKKSGVLEGFLDSKSFPHDVVLRDKSSLTAGILGRAFAVDAKLAL